MDKKNFIAFVSAAIVISGIILIIFLSCFLSFNNDSPAEETTEIEESPAQEMQETIEVRGVLEVVGNEPFIGLVIKIPDGTAFALTGPKVQELWSLQGKNIRIKGRIGGPTIHVAKSIEVTSYEMLE